MSAYHQDVTVLMPLRGGEHQSRWMHWRSSINNLRDVRGIFAKASLMMNSIESGDVTSQCARRVSHRKHDQHLILTEKTRKTPTNSMSNQIRNMHLWNKGTAVTCSGLIWTRLDTYFQRLPRCVPCLTEMLNGGVVEIKVNHAMQSNMRYRGNVGLIFLT